MAGALSSLLDEVVDMQEGLPSAAGNNTAILGGSLSQTTAQLVKNAKVIAKGLAGGIAPGVGLRVGPPRRTA